MNDSFSSGYSGTPVPTVARPLSSELDARHFAHPLDVTARRRMDSLIASRSRIRSFFEAAERTAEQKHYMVHLADDTRLSRRQAASLYRMVEEVSADAGMPCPRVFLDTQPYLNASALGQHQPIISIHSALVDQCSESQVRAVIAHEMGHIRCKHTFYRTVANGFAPVAALIGAIPGGSVIALALQWHLFDWMRKSELSADRFALLVTGDLDAVQGVIIHLAGGSSSLRDELSTDEFREQAKEYRDTVQQGQGRRSLFEKLEYYATELMLNPDLPTHPLPAIRFVEIEDWVHSRQYELLCRGDFSEAEKHPFQYLPENASDDEIDVPDSSGGVLSNPVLKQAASEAMGKLRGWGAKRSPGVADQAKSVFPSSPAPQPPADWYPDPEGGPLLRWWDGSVWTSQTYEP